MALPSLADIVFVVILMIPGFVALILFRWIAVYERKLSDYELTVWSIFFSLLVYGIYGWLVGITNIDSIRDSALMPENLLKILGLSLLIGIVPSMIVKFVFRKHIVRGDCWQASISKASKKGSWVIIYTHDGREYKGILHYAGGREFAKEISIRKPKLISRDSQWDIIEEIEVGKEILFSEKDINRIVFF